MGRETLTSWAGAPSRITKYKTMTQGVYPPDESEKEGKRCSFQSGRLSNPPLKLGQQGPSQGLGPTEKGQSHLVGPTLMTTFNLTHLLKGPIST